MDPPARAPRPTHPGRVRPLNPLKVLARQALIVLVIPPLIFRSDSGRGLHDLAVGSASYVR